MHLNLNDAPRINVVSNFNELVKCEKALDSNLERINSKNIKGLIKIDQENNKYLLIKDSFRDIESFWFCKEIIFYRK